MVQYLKPTDMQDVDSVTAQQLIDKWEPIVDEVINSRTCGALKANSTESFSAVVEADGITVQMPYWVAKQEIKVTTMSDVELQGTVVEADLSGERNSWGRTLILSESSKQPAGTVVNVFAKGGFSSGLPNGLKTVMLTLLDGMEQSASGEDRVTAKSIEDVSVSLTANTPDWLSGILDRFGSVLDAWSFCNDNTGTGEVRYPHKLPRRPYWAPAQDYYSFGWRF